ncbi:hypothetical protein A0257_05455 [Hymenobacter psoromatis]|nr:hypothetical protein A0257_05455 [Hymenobacter psoromatis]
MLQLLGVQIPGYRPANGRHLLALFWPAHHAPLLIELLDLGEAPKLSVAVLELPLINHVMAWWANDPAVPCEVAPLTWCHTTLNTTKPLATKVLRALRAQLDALESSRWPALGSGRDGLGITFWLSDQRGPQQLGWSDTTHELAGTPWTLAVSLLRQAERIPQVQAQVAVALRYLKPAK